MAMEGQGVWRHEARIFGVVLSGDSVDRSAVSNTMRRFASWAATSLRIGLKVPANYQVGLKKRDRLVIEGRTVSIAHPANGADFNDALRS